MVQAAFVSEITREFPSARIDQDTETREIGPTFLWGLKQLEIKTTLQPRQEMYRPHLVLLPFPLFGLCLKVVPLLPTGSSTRKVPSVHDKAASHEIDEKPKNIRVQLKDGNLFPDQIPRRFFK